jgi:toxin ParE1/3/4
MKSRFHEAADAELTEAVLYYDARASGLGDRFLVDVRTATRKLEEYPEFAPIIDFGVRAKVLLSFPYSLMYVVAADELFIVAVAHQSQRPAYWADRLPAGLRGQ